MNDNVKILNISTRTPAKNHVVIIVELSNLNNAKGKVTVGAEVNCGTVTWREKRKTVVMAPNAKSVVEIEFKGISDRIPTMAQKFEYQVRVYSARGKVIEESEKYVGSKPFGPPDRK